MDSWKPTMGRKALQAGVDSSTATAITDLARAKDRVHRYDARGILGADLEVIFIMSVSYPRAHRSY